MSINIWTEIFGTTVKPTITAIMAYNKCSEEKARQTLKKAMIEYINGDITSVIDIRSMLYWAEKQGVID